MKDNKDILEYCNRSNLDQKRLSRFIPKNDQLSKLPVYDIKDIDILAGMARALYKENIDPEIIDPGLRDWYRNYTEIRSCYRLYTLLDDGYLNKTIEEDILEYLLLPYKELPLHLNNEDVRLLMFIKWRLYIRK